MGKTQLVCYAQAIQKLNFGFVNFLMGIYIIHIPKHGQILIVFS